MARHRPVNPPRAPRRGRAARGRKPPPPAPQTLPLPSRLWPPAVVVGLLLVAWEVAHRLQGGSDFLSAGPMDVARSLSHLARSGQLLPAAQHTLTRLLVAYGLALSLGGIVAALMVLWPFLRRGLEPLFLGMQSMPGLAWVPLSLLWFGFTEMSLIFVTLIGSVFAVTMGFVDAFATIPPLFEKAARNMGVRGLRLLLRVTVPAATPHLVSTAKVGWSFAWRSLVGAEIIFANVGIGFLLVQGREFLDLSQVIASMVLVLVFGILFDRILFANLERSIRKRWGLKDRR